MSLEAQLAVAMAVTLCVSPNTHPYDLLVLAPALAYVARHDGGLLVAPVFFVATWLLLPPPQRFALAVALVLFAAWCATLLRQEAYASPERVSESPVPEIA